MREDDSNWFPRWEDLPSLDELMPLSQTLITPDLAIAFDIRNPHTPTAVAAAATPTTPQLHHHHHHQPPQQPPPSSNPSPSHHQQQPSSGGDFADSGDLGSGGAGEEPARTLKRPRLVWTPQLHKRFVDAVAHLGIKNAVPKTIMQLMSVDGLTRENVASHLQKYRLYLKRMQGLSSAGAAGAGGAGGGASDAATDHLFASSPVPPHFLHPAAAAAGRPNSEHFLPFVPVPAMHHHHHQHHHQMAAAAAVATQHAQLQQQFHRQAAAAGHFGSPPNGHFEHPFLSRQQQQQQNQQQMHRMGGAVGGYVEDMESANASGGRKVLTLFPTGDD